MAELHTIETGLTGAGFTAPPAWANVRIAMLDAATVIHSGGGELAGSWHSQNSDEILIVIAGTCTVDTLDGPLHAGSGEIVIIGAGETHRVETTPGTRLIAVESANAIRAHAEDPSW